MSGWFAPASSMRLRSGMVPAARGVSVALEAIARTVEPASWLRRLAGHFGWVEARPVIRQGPIFGTSLGLAVTDDDDADAVPVARRRKRRVEGRPGEPSDVASPTGRPGSVVPAGSAAAARSDPRLARSLGPRMATAPLVALAGGAPEAAGRQVEGGVRVGSGDSPALHRRGGSLRPVPTMPALTSREAGTWRAAVAARGLGRLDMAKSAEAASSASPWSAPLRGPACDRELLDLSAAPHGWAPGSAADSPEGRGTPVAGPAPVSASAPEETPRATAAARDPASPPARPGEADYGARASRRPHDAATGARLESDALFESLLGGGPQSSLPPSFATPEPDTAPEGSTLRPLPAPTGPAVDAGDGALAAPADPVPTAALPPETPLPDMAETIARVLRDEARRHGIDVDAEE